MLINNVFEKFGVSRIVSPSAIKYDLFLFCRCKLGFDRIRVVYVIFKTNIMHNALKYMPYNSFFFSR